MCFKNRARLFWVESSVARLWEFVSVCYLPLVFYFHFLLVITNRGQKRHIKENLYPPFEAIFNVEWSSVHTCWTVVIFSSDIYLVWIRSILCKLHGWAFCSNRYGWDLGNPLIIGSESLNRLTSVRVFLFKNWLVAGGFGWFRTFKIEPKQIIQTTIEFDLAQFTGQGWFKIF